jgi:SAM-dependent methyltransferase
MDEAGSLPKGIDPGTPNDTRMYDYALGGKDNFAADRAAAQKLQEAIPVARLSAGENRRFMRRAVRHLLKQGVRQFLDLGCGLPGRGNVHQLAGTADPEATVVYVDYDPVAVSHYRALLSGSATTAAVQADVRQPGDILTHPDVTRLIDFDRPVGLLMISLLQLIPDDADPAGIVAGFHDALAPGSHLALSHYTGDAQSPETLATFASAVEQMREQVTLRTKAEITELFAGFDLLEPGVVPAPDWRPDRPYETPSGWLLAGVGRTGR